MKLPPYPKYKDSGVPWLGGIPKDWTQRKVKYLFDERVQKGYPNEPLLAATQRHGVILKKDYETRTVTAQKDLHLLKLVEVNDFVISLRSFQGGIEISSCRGIISPAYTVMIPNKAVAHEYFRHLAKSVSFLSMLKTCVTGIREGQNIDYERLRKEILPLPSVETQKVIGKYLDWRSSQINKFIRNKRRLIALLKEQKQNIINKAVTRGINPDVRLKPSGVDWIGNIPEHWEVLRLKYQFKEVDERSTTGTETLLSMRINTGLVHHNSVSNKPIRPDELIGFKRVYPNQMVMNRMRASIGMFAQVVDAGIVSPDYAIFFSVRPTCLQYFCYLFKCPAAKATLRRASKGLGTGESGFLRLYSDSFGRIKVAIPPLVEQLQIIEWIESSSSSINAAITKAERQIQLMTEYRDRLIADVVTGKVDVRGVAVPDVVDEESPDLMDDEDIADVEAEDTLEEENEA